MLELEPIWLVQEQRPWEEGWAEMTLSMLELSASRQVQSQEESLDQQQALRA